MTEERKNERQPVKPDAHGFLRGRAPFSQLRTLFDCGADAEFETIKDAVVIVCDKYLDVALPATRQREKLERVMKKLGKHAWFAEDSERRLHFARKTVLDYHYKKCLKERRRQIVEDGDYDPNSDNGEAWDYFDDVPLSELGVAVPPAIKAVDHPAVVKVAEEPVNIHVPVDFLATFLASCKPDMTRYLDIFKTFGLDEESLRAFSGPNWTTEDRLGIIRRAITSGTPSDGHLALKEVHVCILVHHLLSYFKA